MKEWNKILKLNKDLDKEFIEKYSSDKDYYKKNCIALLVELGEFINETKYFKYWSVKKPIKEKVLEEYADTITMCLSFFTTFNIELNNIPNHFNTDDILLLINKLFEDASYMMEKGNEELIKNIFSNLLYLGNLLEFKDEEMYEACYKKMNIVEERLNENY